VAAKDVLRAVRLAIAEFVISLRLVVVTAVLA
jgi:hypothetical protein